MSPALLDLNIREGYTLIVDGVSYPIRGIQTYESAFRSASSFRRMATKTASVTRRAPDGLGDYTTETTISSIRCTPLDPISMENQRREILTTPQAQLETYIASATGYIKLLLEELKR